MDNPIRMYESQTIRDLSYPLEFCLDAKRWIFGCVRDWLLLLLVFKDIVRQASFAFFKDQGQKISR